MIEISSGCEYEYQEFKNINSDRGCDCRMTDFLNSTFSKTNLTKADFSKAKNYAIDYRINILTQAKFSLPEAVALLELLEIVIAD
jgi:fluoroquinolone resistance protein